MEKLINQSAVELGLLPFTPCDHEAEECMILIWKTWSGLLLIRECKNKSGIKVGDAPAPLAYPLYTRPSMH